MHGENGASLCGIIPPLFCGRWAPLPLCQNILTLLFALMFFGRKRVFGLSFFQADFATKFCDSNFKAQYLTINTQQAAEICSVC